MQRLRLVHWNEAEAEERAQKLQAMGYRVDFDPLSQEVLKALRESPPDAVVIDLGRLPSHGRDMGVAIRTYKATRAVPLVFVEGDPKKVIKIRVLLPDAVYTDWDDLQTALARAISEPPAEPVVPVSTMAGYSGTPLPKKLGLSADSVLVLFGAPTDFEATLGEIPTGALVRRDGPPGTVNIWFVTTRAELEGGIADKIGCGEQGRLWIAWPKKASGVMSDLSQAVVRGLGLDSGLVDFKIAAIDDTWSGLCFTKRKDDR